MCANVCVGSEFVCMWVGVGVVVGVCFGSDRARMDRWLMIRGSVLWEELFSTRVLNKSRRVMLQALQSFSHPFILKETYLALHYYSSHSLFSVQLGGDDKELWRLTLTRLAMWRHHCELWMPLSRKEMAAFVRSYIDFQIKDLNAFHESWLTCVGSLWKICKNVLESVSINE